jgi:hypothetical protein
MNKLHSSIFSLFLLILLSTTAPQVRAQEEEIEEEEGDFQYEEEEDFEQGDDLPFDADMYDVERKEGDEASGDSEDSDDEEEHDFDLYSELNAEDLEDTLEEDDEEDWFLTAEETNKEPKCRDDSYMECVEVEQSGDCSKNNTGILATSRRNLCPVTCGLCHMEANAVWLEHDCFQHSEDIHVFFHNKEPELYDFIGIYPADYNLQEQPELLLNAHLWLTTCGGLHEYCKTAKGGLLFGNLGPSDQTTWNFFPLVPGDYKAALARGDDPHELIVESQVFTAKPEGHACYDDCKHLISADKECYTHQVDTIQVTFEYCSPHEDDLIAIYQYDEKPGDMEPLLWLGTCGTQQCTEEVAYNVLFFGPRLPNESARTNWPLPPGDYTAHLMKFVHGANHGVASAQTAFKVREQCQTNAL